LFPIDASSPMMMRKSGGSPPIYLKSTNYPREKPGFGARRQRGTAISYVLFYRTREGRQRWFTIGRHGAPWTPDSAREEAQRLLGSVVNSADPAAEKRAARNAQTVSELCDLYLADAEGGRLVTRLRTAKKPSTLATDRGRMERHIKPLLGRRAVASVTRNDIETFMHDVAAGKTAGNTKTKPRGLACVRGGKGTASRTVGLLGAIFSYAVRHRMCTENPVRGVIRPVDGRRERRLSDDEYKALAQGLHKAEAKHVWPAAIAVARFLALTGWRSGEALALRGNEFDLDRRTARTNGVGRLSIFESRLCRSQGFISPLRASQHCSVLRRPHGQPRGAGAREGWRCAVRC